MGQSPLSVTSARTFGGIVADLYSCIERGRVNERIKRLRKQELLLTRQSWMRKKQDYKIGRVAAIREHPSKLSLEDPKLEK
jgi:hypothetical protein